MANWMKCQPECQKCEQNLFLCVMLIKQSYCMRQKSYILLVVISPGIAETNVGRGGKINSHLMASCVGNIRTKKLSKSDNWFSSYSRKCGGCFF